VLRASAAVERAGLPSVSIISTAFLKQAEVVARGLGIEDLAIAEYPGVPMTDSEDDVRAKAASSIADRIVRALTAAPGSAPAAGPAVEPKPRDIVFRGTLDAVIDHFDAKLWSDGLPVVPPTPERVERFLRFTDRDPDETIAACPPENRRATVWSVAVNGVMAGCRPEYMPLLIAVVEAVTDPEFRVQDAGSTPGWESLVIVSGPIARALDFNSGASVMRVGRRANTSVGRFLRLFLRNLSGLRIPPGAGDKGSIAQSFLVALAENEEICREIGWPTFAEDHGFAAGESVVTVQSVVAVSPPVYSGSERAIEHMRLFADVMGDRTCAYWSAVALAYPKWHPLIVVGPSIARVFAKDGWSKDAIRRYFYEQVRIPARLAEHYAWNVGLTDIDIRTQVARGLLPREYHASDDPERPVPVFMRPEWIGIAVAGDWGRNQSKCYVNNHVQGPPVSRRVRLPADWDARLAAAR